MVFIRYNGISEFLAKRIKDMDENSGFEEIAHTADWALHVWAPDLSELMLNAVQGMYSLSEMNFTEDVESHVSFTIQAFDEESLLVEFLNEILFYAENNSLGLGDLTLNLEGNSVKVEANGRKILQRKKEIKAVTYHNLEIIRSVRGLEAVLIFDV